MDTALLLGGMLFCQSYFDGNDADEVEIRRLADEIYSRVDWRWAQAAAQIHGWTPESAFITHDWHGYNEAMLVYIALAPRPIRWRRTHGRNGGVATRAIGTRLYGQKHLTFTPLFGHQYTHVWVDFRGILDAPMRAAGFDSRIRGGRRMPSAPMRSRTRCAGTAMARTSGA